VYVVDNSGSVLCCDLQSGDDVWAAGTNRTVAPYAISASATAVVAGTESGTVFAFDPSDGTELWSRSVAAEVSSLQISGDTLLYGLGEKIGALELASGAPAWPAKEGTDTYVPMRAGVTENTVAFADGVSGLKALSLDTGSEKWRVELNDWDNEASTAGVDALDGAFYFVGEHGRLARVEAADGTVTWRINIDDNSLEFVTVAGDYVAAVGNSVHVFTASTGRRQYSAGIDSYEAASVWGSELVVAGVNRSGDRVVTGLELGTGVTNWQYEIDDNDWSELTAPAVSESHAVIVDAASDSLSAIWRTAESTSTTTTTPTSTTSSPPQSTTDDTTSVSTTHSAEPTSTAPQTASTTTASRTPTTTNDGSNRGGGDPNRGFFTEGDDILQESLTPWGLTVLGLAVSIGSIAYQHFKYE
jgi:outer membrane protein assembly factor BamB